VDGARHAVCDFDIQLGNRIFRINRSLADIPNSSALHHVPHSETLDGFILWDGTRAVGTADESDMATTLLVAATVSSFLGLQTNVQLVSLRIEEARVIQVHDRPSTLHLNCPRYKTQSTSKENT
jgi:hypothetical protein